MEQTPLPIAEMGFLLISLTAFSITMFMLFRFSAKEMTEARSFHLMKLMLRDEDPDAPVELPSRKIRRKRR